MKYPTLVLNSDFKIHRVVDWRQAFVLVYSKDNGAYTVATYDKVIHDSMGRPYNIPAVIALSQYVGTNDKRASFSKRAVHLRDGYTCQYCQGKFTPDKVNLDHVYPRTKPHKLPSSIKMNSFENCVTACIKCNAYKADKTPEEAKIRLMRVPKPITRGQKVYYEIINKAHIPEEWKPYIEGMKT